MLEVSLLGKFAVHLDSRPIEIPWHPGQLLLAYLILNAGTAQRREKLAGLLWPDSDELNARNNLRQTLWRLRQALGEDYILADKTSVGFNQEANYHLDVDLLLDDGAETSSADELIQMVSAYEGNLLPGFYEDWVVLEQERLQAIFEDRMQLLLDRLIEAARWREVREWAERWIAQGQVPEPAYRALMMASAGLGDQAGMAAAFQRCVAALAEEVGVEPSPETQELFQKLTSGETLPKAKTRDTKPSSLVKLPLQPTPFIGREEELARLATLLADPTVKLVTLLGPGGIGKTRLAIEAARAQTEAFADGVYFVSLASLDSPVMISSQMANALNFAFYVRDQREHGEDDPQIEQLLAYLQEKQLLLVLDNTEHLLATALPSLPKREKSVDELVATIVRVAPNVKILATSRERLNLHGETLLPLDGLSVPERETNKTQDVPSLENVLDFVAYGAIELFRQSARRVQPGFELRSDNLIDVINICYLVEGMPLGVELAAAWVELLSPAEIATEIRDSLDFLETNLRDIPDRQRSIRSVFETSWQRLSQTEQDVFQQLSIFRGGFSREAMQIVTGASLRTLMALVNKSLLRPDFKGRYQMHELLRQFAGEKLAQRADEATATRERHSDYYLGFLKAREKLLTGKEQPKALDEISIEIDNIRTGWRWAVEQGHLETIDQVVEALYNFYEIRSRYQEGEEIFAHAVTQLQQPDALSEHPRFEHVLSRVNARRGALCIQLGDYEAANQYLQVGLTTGNQSERAFSLRFLGNIALSQAERSIAEERFRKSLAISQEIGDQKGVADALRELSLVAMRFGEYATAKQLARESLALSRQLDRPDLVAYALGALLWTTNCLGEYGQAEAYEREILRIGQEIGNRHQMAWGLNNLGWTTWCLGGARLAEAMVYNEEALAMFREIGSRYSVSMCLADLALIANELGEQAKAQQYGQESVAIARELGDPDRLSYNLFCLGAATAGLGDFRASRNYLLEAIQTAWEVRIPDKILVALFYYATVLVKESDDAGVPEPIQTQKKVKALELVALVRHHPATYQAFKDRAARLQAELEMELPPEVVATAKARGKSMKLEDVVVEILRETV